MRLDGYVRDLFFFFYQNRETKINFLFGVPLEIIKLRVMNL